MNWKKILLKILRVIIMMNSFDKVNGLTIMELELSDSYNEVYYGIDSRRYNAIIDMINYLISKKSDITDNINHNFAIIWLIQTDTINWLI